MILFIIIFILIFFTILFLSCLSTGLLYVLYDYNNLEKKEYIEMKKQLPENIENTDINKTKKAINNDNIELDNNYTKDICSTFDDINSKILVDDFNTLETKEFDESKKYVWYHTYVLNVSNKKDACEYFKKIKFKEKNVVSVFCNNINLKDKNLQINWLKNTTECDNLIFNSKDPKIYAIDLEGNIWRNNENLNKNWEKLDNKIWNISNKGEWTIIDQNIKFDNIDSSGKGYIIATDINNNLYKCKKPCQKNNNLDPDKNNVFTKINLSDSIRKDGIESITVSDVKLYITSKKKINFIWVY